MGNQRYGIQRLAEATGVTPAALTGKPIIEVAGDRRVLIENHMGVKEYSHEKLCIQVSFGCISIMGTNLELVQMTKEQLIVCGNIQCIQLLRKEDPCSF